MSGLGVNQCSTNTELIKYCANPPHECILGGIPYGNKVVQISSQAVVKFGVGVTKAEADNQVTAYEVVDPQVVRIPKSTDTSQTMNIEDTSSWILWRARS